MCALYGDEFVARRMSGSSLAVHLRWDAAIRRRQHCSVHPPRPKSSVLLLSDFRMLRRSAGAVPDSRLSERVPC
jgi:hypothetical protein